jgi:hypothetical protein
MFYCSISSKVHRKPAKVIIFFCGDLRLDEDAPDPWSAGVDYSVD